MSEAETGSQPATAPQPTTENQAATRNAGEISSLANYMARRKDSSSSAPEQSKAGEGAPNAAATQPPQDNREQFIPRSRFDEVLNERNALRQQQQQAPQAPQAQQPQEWQQPQQAPAPQLNTGMQNVPQWQPPQQGFQSPTGMVGQQQAPQQAQRPANVPDFSDANVQKEWRTKIANNPVTGLREFVSLLIQAEGAPLLEQFRQQITSQITPLQQSFVQQQLTSYTSHRQQSDPTFAQIAPAFNQLVAQAQQRGYQLTPQTLQAIEGIARSQSGHLYAPAPQAPQVPFTEAPGSSGSFGQPSEPTLTNEQLAMAKRFNMTPAEYAAAQRTYRG